MKWLTLCGNSFTALTRDHHVRHLHQCPEVVSLTRQATSCLVPSEEELVLCIPQSANLCGIEYPDTVLHAGVRQSASVMSARALFNSHRFDSGSSNGLTRHSP